MLEWVRYIHLNPVRAGLVDDPLDSPWSGHRAYLGQEVLPWLTTDWVLSTLAEPIDLARDQYRQFVLAGTNEGHRAEFHGGEADNRVLGDDRFIEQTLGKLALSPTNQLASLDAIEWQVCAVYGIKPIELASPGRGRKLAEARGLIGWLAMRCGCGSLREVTARYFSPRGQSPAQGRGDFLAQGRGRGDVAAAGLLKLGAGTF